MSGGWLLRCALVGVSLIAGCGLFDIGGSRSESPVRGEWVKYEPPNAFCSDGSPYAFYVQFSESGSENLMFYFQAGGVCWDYASCTPGGGARQAANPNGLPDDYANMHDEIRVGPVAIRPNVKEFYPLLNDNPDISPMADWNKVFVPYCTGDGYAGASSVTYVDPAGVEADNEFLHVGHLNVLAMIDMLDSIFPSVDKLFVGGGSAGGVGALVNYYFIRTGLNVEGRGHLLSDSGPIYPALEPTSRSTQLYETVRDVWNLDAVIDSGLPSPDLIKDDFGAISTVLADEFPNDRFAATLYRLDYNYTLYSYERFYRVENGTITEFEFDGSLGLDENSATDRTAIYSLWWDDLELLKDLYDGRDNLGYFLPYWRQTNESHLTTIPGAEDSPLEDFIANFPNLVPELTWVGTEINTVNGVLDIRDYTEILLNDQVSLPSYFEEQSEGPFVPCTPAEDYDAEACEQAVAAN